jgi:GTP-binding protein
MLTDEIRIEIKGGDGGDGIAHFYSDAFRPKGGPDGGDGGDGGSVYFEAVADISRLNQFKPSKKYSAENGEPGGRNKRKGKNGDDLILQVPVGTVAAYDNGTSVELTEVGQRVLMAKGGKGGHGNHFFRSATNQTPQEFQRGYKTTPKQLFLQLKLIAQVGLIGLPNAGKTSLLNELTAANARVANYAFTTLEPNLGVMRNGKIIADIPGLIEGAAVGKGLGFKFLKHIERTELLVHCVSAESVDPVTDYKIVRQELENYSNNLAKKPEIIVLTKSDVIQPEDIKKMSSLIKAKLPVSIIDTESLKNLNDLIAKELS